MEQPDAIESDLAALEASAVDPITLQALFSSRDEGVILACALQLEERLQAGEALDVESLLPADLFALPPEAQLVLARLAEAGHRVRAVEPPPGLAPRVRLAWLRAHLLASPASAEAWAGTPIGWAAAADLPLARVVASGLLERLAESADATFRGEGLGYLRAAVADGLVAREAAHSIAERLANDGEPPVALSALSLLRAPWAHGMPLALREPSGDDVDLQRAYIDLWEARRLVGALRAALARPNLSAALVGRVLRALGNVGDATDVARIAREMRSEGDHLSGEGFRALQAAKRRGLGVDEDDALALATLAVVGPATDIATVAEVLGGRSDRIIAGWEAEDWDDARAPARVALLEAFGTRAAIARLRRMLARPGERAAIPYAVLALGRLGVDDAEDAILGHFDAAPDEALLALGYVGGARTVAFLSARLDDADEPAWGSAAAALVFRLAPSAALFERLAARGRLTAAILDAVPSRGPCLEGLRALAGAAGGPLRAAAIGALGRSGSPMALSVLGALLDAPDASVRDGAAAALRALGADLAAHGALRPAGLCEAADPGGAALADTLVARLSEVDLPRESAERLLDALAACATPSWTPPARFVPVVRGYLRAAPELRKRAIACLAAAGGAAIAWVLPWLDDDDITVARRAMYALAALRAEGNAARIARWLRQPNMNLKKAAAETLAVVGDASVVSELVGWVASHDNPGFREALVAALRHVLGERYRGAMVDALAVAETPRSQELCARALSGEWTASEVAALVHVRGGGHAPWCTRLLELVYDGTVGLKSGSLLELDSALRRWGVAPPTAATRDAKGEPLRSGVHAQRAGMTLRDALRSHASSDLSAALSAASAPGAFVVPALSRSEIRRLVAAYPHLAPDARASARSVLERCTLDPVTTLRLARALDGEPDATWPHGATSLSRSWASTMTIDRARTLAESSNGAARHAAWQTLLLADAPAALEAPEEDAQRWLDGLVRRGDHASAAGWAVRHRRFAQFFRTLARLRGARVAIVEGQRVVAEQPALREAFAGELARIGEAGAAALEDFVFDEGAPLRVREAAATELSRSAAPPFLRALLGDAHPSIREVGAQALLDRGAAGDRAQVLQAYLEGRLRTSFVPRVRAEDVAVLRRAPLLLGEAARRFVSLAEATTRVAPTLAVERLLELWSASDEGARELARDALRRLEVGAVLPRVRDALEAGSTRALAVLQAPATLPAELIGYFHAQGATDAWLDYLERCAGGGSLHAPGIASPLARHLEGPRRARVLSLLLRLTEWQDAANVPSLLALLGPELASERRAETVRQLVAATERLDVATRGRVLSAALDPSDEEALPSLVDAMIAVPELDLSPSLDRAARASLRAALRGEPERARRLLGFLSARARTDGERAALVDDLEGAMAHASPRVRLYAHRLLRSHAERARYLSATRALLGDGDRGTVRTAIRALTHGGDLESVDAIAAFLAHPHPLLRKAAEEGLLVLGADASPRLRKAQSRARPDHREAYAKVLARIAAAES